jgi:hypothetical protein
MVLIFLLEAVKIQFTWWRTSPKLALGLRSDALVLPIRKNLARNALVQYPKCPLHFCWHEITTFVTVHVFTMLGKYFVSVKYVFVCVKLMCVYVKLLKI